MSGARVFFDSNILIYGVDNRDAEKWRVARRLLGETMDSQRAVISLQVLQETVNVLRKGPIPFFSIDQCHRLIELYADRAQLIYPSSDLLIRGLHIHERFQTSWYDSLIVAAAQAGKCQVLYSEDLGDGQKFGGVEVVNPFRKKA